MTTKKAMEERLEARMEARMVAELHADRIMRHPCCTLFLINISPALLYTASLGSTSLVKRFQVQVSG